MHSLGQCLLRLSLLSRQAKDMVELSKSIANKIKDKQGDITEDEVHGLHFKAFETILIVLWCFGGLLVCFVLL